MSRTAELLAEILTVRFRASFVALAAIGVALVIPAAASAELDFARSDYPAGDGPLDLVVGAFDAGPDLDLAVANNASDDVSVLLGGAGSSFGAPSSFAAGDAPNSVVTSDFNNDSDPDLAVADGASGEISVLLGGAGGSFGAPTGFATSALSLAVDDFNADLDPDLAAVNDTADGWVLLGGPGGSFGVPNPLSFGGGGEQTIAITSADFNADADPDLAVIDNEGLTSFGRVFVFVGEPGGAFSQGTEVGAGAQLPSAIAVGDFNDDTDPDLAVTSAKSRGIVSVLPGAAGASFDGFNIGTYWVGGFPGSIAVGDLNGDKDPDLAVTKSGAGVAVLLGGPGASFGEPTGYAAGCGPASVAMGHFDRDSHLDLAVANSCDDDVSVLTQVASGPPECTATGTVGADRLTGTARNDVVCGKGGDDILRGKGGDDILRGQGGDDRLLGDPDRAVGADRFDGGGGVDLAVYSDRSADLELSIGDGPNDGAPGEGDEILADVEGVRGGGGADGLSGDGSANVLLGGPGPDRIVGRAGDDHLSGGAGDDLVDALDAPRFTDRLSCGEGIDRTEADPSDHLGADCEG